MRKEERGRRNSPGMSGKMCFSVTMPFSVHNLSHGALWGMCLSLPPTGRGQNQSWLIVGLVFTVALTYMSSFYLSHQKGQTHSKTAPKKRGDCCLADHRSVSWNILNAIVCLLNAPLIWMTSVCSKILWDIDEKKQSTSLLICVTRYISLSDRLIYPCSLSYLFSRIQLSK